MNLILYYGIILVNLRVQLGAKPRENVHGVIDSNAAHNSVRQLSAECDIISIYSNTNLI